jgi:hypothetical protein
LSDVGKRGFKGRAHCPRSLSRGTLSRNEVLRVRISSCKENIESPPGISRAQAPKRRSL